MFLYNAQTILIETIFTHIFVMVCISQTVMLKANSPLVRCLFVRFEVEVLEGVMEVVVH